MGPLGGAERAPPAQPSASNLVTPEAKEFWSFRPVLRPALPHVEASDWIRQPLDAFVLARLEAERLSPATPASKITLVRRLHHDLTGLPPTPDEVDKFLRDQRPDAYERLVERLLASPRYGERWGRHWLDVVRYGESNSFERDSTKPNVWRFRDYVIAAFNRDMPFDQFIREQLAGDELDEVTRQTIIATGYYRLGQWDDEPTDKLQAKYDELDDIISTTSQAFLGLTMNCARCHDHKLDPVPQTNYYSMLAFFHGILPFRYGKETVQTDIADAAQRKAYEAAKRAKEQKLEPLREKIDAIMETVIAQLDEKKREAAAKNSGRRRKLFQASMKEYLTAAQIEEFEKLKKARRKAEELPLPKLDFALSVKEGGPEGPETFVLLRGNAHSKGDPVHPAFPDVLSFPAPKVPLPKEGATTSGRRRTLAEWIARPDNQLTPRVMVNRIWQHHFGRGIVASPNNFGQLGTRPTHPALLDWLADEFVVSGWSVKHMHRLLLNSSTYRMSSESNPKGLSKDPENRLLWRSNMRRLAAEEIRDSILAVSGSLNVQAGGPSVYPKIPTEILQTQSRPGKNWNTSTIHQQNRRSIYVHVKRSLILPIFAAFDFADTDSSCPVRFTTTQPTQALTMLNSEFLGEAAEDFAARLRRETRDAPSTQVRRALQLVLCRPPTADEIEAGVKLMQELRAEATHPAVALQQFCLMTFNLNEFFYLD